MPNYRTSEPALMHTPLKDVYGQAFTRARGIVKDYLAQQVRQAVVQRMPAFAAPDSLGAIGAERNIDRGDSIQLGSEETTAAYAQRLIDAWNLWTLGGTAWGMLKAFAAQGYFPQLVCANGLFYSVNGSLVLSITQGPVLSLPLPIWNQFFVWFGTAPSSWTSIATPPTSSTVPSRTDVQLLRRIINLWRPAWAKCIGIGVSVSGGEIWGAPGVTWGGGQVWGAGSVVWFSADDILTWGLPPGITWGSGYTWGQQV